MNIAILGATSHIAKGLIDRFLHRNEDHLFLFTRSEDKITQFLSSLSFGEPGCYTILTDYNMFQSLPYDVIINCIGVETRNKHNCDFTRYFSVTEEFDRLVINYLKNQNPEAIYISFSSGAVYGSGFSNPVDNNSTNNIKVNHIIPENYYGIARINAEAKHRAHSNLRIIDLRIFSYFSRYINLTDGYFITDVIEAIQKNSILITDNNNIIRDYLHPEDLFGIIMKCVKAEKINKAFDVTSSKPVTKQDILDFFTSEYNLKYEHRIFSENASATGVKTNYYSVNKNSELVGYFPHFSSLDTIKDETKYLLI